MTNENIEAVELKRTAQKINREDEGRITQVLIDYLISLQQNDDVAMMDPDGDYAFVLVTFIKPSKKVQDKRRAEGLPQTDPVDVSLLNLCPEVDVGDDNMTDAASVVKTGIHAVCGSVLSRWLAEQAIPTTISQVQHMLTKRKEMLDD